MRTRCSIVFMVDGKNDFCQGVNKKVVYAKLASELYHISAVAS